MLFSPYYAKNYAGIIDTCTGLGVKYYIRMFMHIKLVKMGLVAFDRLKLAP